LQFLQGRFNLDMPSGLSTMPDDKKLDPFRPTQPQIPGVAAALVEEQAPSLPPVEIAEVSPPRKNASWIVAAASSAVVVGALLGWWALSSSSRSSSADVETPAPVSGSSLSASQPAANLPVGPGEIATTEELSKAWSAKRFLFHNPLTDETLPAMVVRLPGGTYWGFSLREPYGTCEMEFVTDLPKLQTFYNFNAAHPMVADPCDHSVFDLTHYGSAPGGLVRGEIAMGPAIRPPVAIEITTRANKVIAARIE
jgi:hypothetical protein